MSPITSIQLVRDHLSLGPQYEGRRAGSILLALLPIALAAGVAIAVIMLGISSTGIGALLTATSIMTGLTFTMALRFWERSLDARSNEDMMYENKRFILDHMRTLLLWTVVSGVISSGWLAAVALIAGKDPATPWASGVAAALVSYQLFYVFRSLVSLYSASYNQRP